MAIKLLENYACIMFETEQETAAKRVAFIGTELSVYNAGLILREEGFPLTTKRTFLRPKNRPKTLIIVGVA